MVDWPRGARKVGLLFLILASDNSNMLPFLFLS